MISRPCGFTSVSLRLIAVVLVLAARTSSHAQNEQTSAPTASVNPAAAALAGFDETTGLWFPPDAPREVYLANSDPNHNLTRDMQKAFAADPALRKAACALATDPKREVRTSGLDQSVKQMRTRFQMLCAGSAGAEQNKRRNEEVWRENEVRFERARNAASARALTFDERRARFLDIEARTPMLADDFQRLDQSFEMLGLMPQAEDATYRLLTPSFFMKGSLGGVRFREYLQRLFERESADGMPEAALYRMGMRNYLYLTNRLPEAQAATRSLIEVSALARWKTDNRAILGLLDRLAGDVSALKRVGSHCSTPEREAMNYRGRPEGAYCYDVSFGLASENIELNGEAAPAGLADVLEEVIAAEPANWTRRSTAIRYVVRLNAKRGRELAEELLRIPATISPLDARLDALDDLAAASRKLHDFPRALAALDRYLALLRYRPMAVPPNLWEALTAVPEQEKGPPSEIERIGWLNIPWALGEKAETSTEAGDFPAARRAVEAFLANALNFAHELEKDSVKGRLAQLVDLVGLEPGERKALETLLGQESDAVRRAARDQARWARNYLRLYGAALVKAGQLAEAKRVAAYLIAQPGGEGNLPTALFSVVYEGRSPGEPLPTARTPWGPTPDAGAVTPPRRR